jgi:hypothetical protein
MFPIHEWQHAAACVHATDPLGGRIQWAARVITGNELMNKKRVISMALSMAVNCMTQTSISLNITLKVLFVYNVERTLKNRSYRNMVHANLGTCIQSRISPSYHNNNKLGLVFELFFFLLCVIDLQFKSETDCWFFFFFLFGHYWYWYRYICWLQLCRYPVAVVLYTFTHKQYIEQHIETVYTE